MKNKQISSKLFKTALSTSLAVGAMVVAAPYNTEAAVTNFKDLPKTSDHYEPVMTLVDRGVIQGFEDGTFKPNASVTRGQAAKIIALALKLDTTNVKNPGFKDVSTNHAYYGPIAALVQAGIITGFPEDNTYRPGDTLTRAQMSKIISIAFKLPEATEIKHSFADVKSTSWYKGYVQTLVNYQVTIGTTATTFEPASPVRRGQLASFVIRAEKAVVTPPPTGGGGGGGGYFPPTPPAGNVPLYNAISTAYNSIQNPVPDKVTLQLNGKTLDVTVKDDSTTFGDFRAAAQPIFEEFSDKVVVTSVFVQTRYADGTVAKIDKKTVKNYKDLEEIIQAALRNAKVSETDTISFLKGGKVDITISGKFDNQDFLDEYSFTFK